MATRSDYLKLHFIVFLWGFSAILGKLVSIPAIEMIFYRGILAAAGFFIAVEASYLYDDIRQFLSGIAKHLL